MSCTECTVHACFAGGALPSDCTSNLASEDVREKACAFYLESDVAPLVNAASEATHAALNGKWPRIRELILFAHEMGAHRIGIASCKSFIPESEMLADILRSEGFEPIDAMCRIGSLRRSDVGLHDESPERANMLTCNPYMQADVLNEAGCDFNIIMGLCLGHDMMFTKRSNAWVTTLAIKDWSCAHDKPIARALKDYLGSE